MYVNSLEADSGKVGQENDIQLAYLPSTSLGPTSRVSLERRTDFCQIKNVKMSFMETENMIWESVD